MSFRIRLALALALSWIATGCSSADSRSVDDARPEPPSARAPASNGVVAAAATGETTGSTGTAAAAPAAAAHVHDEPGGPAGDPKRGKELVARFECSRCHDGTGVASAPRDKHCVTCHRDIDEGRIGGTPAKVAAWREHTAHLRDVPSLQAMSSRFRRGWVERFLLDPHDVRPRLVPTMPRLALSPAQAKDIAAYLVHEERPAEPAAAVLAGASAEHGASLFEAKGCTSCHLFTGTARGAGAEPEIAPEGSRKAVELRRAVALAPDLRFTRDRLRPEAVVQWLRNPQAMKADTQMPLVPMSEQEARELSAYVLTTPLAARPTKPKVERLPVLARRVGYEEVRDRVFGRTCNHCHGDLQARVGDGGPGVVGGFGFPARKLSFVSYPSIAAGYVDEQDQRQSVFAKTADGTPRLVAALLARHDEEAGRGPGAVRGMPLGLPGLTPEEIQLVESWVAQGRPQ